MSFKSNGPAEGRPGTLCVAAKPVPQAFIGKPIIVMPPQPIIMGMPICIMFIMLSQHFMNMSFMARSIGIIYGSARL